MTYLLSMKSPNLPSFFNFCFHARAEHVVFLSCFDRYRAQFTVYESKLVNIFRTGRLLVD